MGLTFALWNRKSLWVLQGDLCDMEISADKTYG